MTLIIRQVVGAVVAAVAAAGALLGIAATPGRPWRSLVCLFALALQTLATWLCMHWHGADLLDHCMLFAATFGTTWAAWTAWRRLHPALSQPLQRLIWRAPSAEEAASALGAASQ